MMVFDELASLEDVSSYRLLGSQQKLNNRYNPLIPFVFDNAVIDFVDSRSLSKEKSIGIAEAKSSIFVEEKKKTISK